MLNELDSFKQWHICRVFDLNITHHVLTPTQRALSSRYSSEASIHALYLHKKSRHCTSLSTLKHTKMLLISVTRHINQRQLSHLLPIRGLGVVFPIISNNCFPLVTSGSRMLLFLACPFIIRYTEYFRNRSSLRLAASS